MLGDITAGPAYRFAQWLELVRKRSDKYRAWGSHAGLTGSKLCPPGLLFPSIFVIIYVNHQTNYGD
jgi:hypothetical protein